MAFEGIPYPITQNPLGFFRVQRNTEQIKSDLLQLLLTNPGERVMLADFGTPLRQLIFEQNDELTALRAREIIINSINLWEPRITVTNLEVTLGSETTINSELDENNSERILFIRIQFVDPQDIQSVEELVIQRPLAT